MNLLSSLGKEDALMFNSLANFVWNIDGHVTALVYDEIDPLFIKQGLNFSRLKHLDSLGLISFQSLPGYKLFGMNRQIITTYQSHNFKLEIPESKAPEIEIGKVMLTRAGIEILNICTANEVPGLVESITERWKSQGYLIS